MQNLTVPVMPIDFAWFGNTAGTHLTAINPDTYLSLARYARRNYAVDISPVVREYVILESTNEWGDEVVATIQYNSRGHVSSVGGQLNEDGTINWSCYAD